MTDLTIHLPTSDPDVRRFVWNFVQDLPGATAHDDYDDDPNCDCQEEYDTDALICRCSYEGNVTDRYTVSLLENLLEKYSQSYSFSISSLYGEYEEEYVTYGGEDPDTGGPRHEDFYSSLKISFRGVVTEKDMGVSKNFSGYSSEYWDSEISTRRGTRREKSPKIDLFISFEQ